MTRRTWRKSLRDTLAENERALKWLSPSGALTKDMQQTFDKDRLPPKRVYARRIVPSEHQEQVGVINWWRLSHRAFGLPEIALFAIPNGGQRDPITGSRLKSEGVRRGAFDLMLAAPRRNCGGLFIEMKRSDQTASSVSDDQKIMRDYLLSAGYVAEVHFNSGSAIDAIKAYLGVGALEKKNAT